MKIQEIKNTLGPHQRETLVLRKGDVGGTVHFTVPDLTGITSADFRLIKPDGTFVVKSGAIVQNTVIVQITEQMCTVYGSGIYNLELKASGVSVYTAIGRCLIDKNIDLNDYAASVAEVNGLVFPDDFLTSTDLSDYATKAYVDTSISRVTQISYSTTEQDTGLKWIDGKHIYQKTLQFVANDTLVNIADLNIDNVVDYKGLWRSSSNALYPLDTLALWTGQTSDSYFSRLVFSDDISGVKVTVNGWTFASGFITLYYTKTTDIV